MELKFRYRFEAAHRFVNSASVQCMTPHGHTWHATLHLEAKRNELDENDMVAEFSQLKSYWKKLITEVFDHSYMCNEEDALIPVLKTTHSECRLLVFPGDPTTELISVMMFAKMQNYVQNSEIRHFVRITGINIEETPTNSLTCDREFYEECINQYHRPDNWWNSLDVYDRSFSHIEKNVVTDFRQRVNQSNQHGPSN